MLASSAPARLTPERSQLSDCGSVSGQHAVCPGVGVPAGRLRVEAIYSTWVPHVARAIIAEELRWLN